MDNKFKQYTSFSGMDRTNKIRSALDDLSGRWKKLSSDENMPKDIRYEDYSIYPGEPVRVILPKGGCKVIIIKGGLDTIQHRQIIYAYEEVLTIDPGTLNTGDCISIRNEDIIRYITFSKGV